MAAKKAGDDVVSWRELLQCDSRTNLLTTCSISHPCPLPRHLLSLTALSSSSTSSPTLPPSGPSPSSYTCLCLSPLPVTSARSLVATPHIFISPVAILRLSALNSRPVLCPHPLCTLRANADVLVRGLERPCHHKKRGVRVRQQTDHYAGAEQPEYGALSAAIADQHGHLAVEIHRLKRSGRVALGLRVWTAGLAGASRTPSLGTETQILFSVCCNDRCLLWLKIVCHSSINMKY